MGNPYADYDSETAHTPMQEDPPETTPSLPTTLLSLPAELLLEIGFALAPHGGAKVSSFRLASVHLAKVLAPVLWAAITFSSSIHTLDPLLVAIQSDERGHNALVASVRFEVPTPHLAFPIAVLRLLRNLRRLHIIGTGRPLGIAMAEVVRSATSLERLELEHLDLTDRYALSTWAPTVRELSVLDCQSQDDLFDDGRALIARAPLTSIDYAVPGNFPASDQSAIVMNALQAVQATAKTVVLRWDHAEDFSNIDIGGPCAVRSFPISLSIVGLPDLFSPADAPSHLQATLAVVKLLNWVSPSPLTALSLPFQNVFQLGQSFNSLRLPHLQRFALVRNANPLGRNLLKADAYIALVTLLTTLKDFSPHLHTLTLRGWFDKTGAVALGLVAQSSPIQFATHHVFLVGLLHLLRGTSVMTLRIENGVGHKDGDAGCWFERSGKGEWRVRVVRFW